MKYLLILSFLILTSCSQEAPKIVEDALRANAELLCASDGYIGQYNKYIKDGDILTCYQTEPNGRIIKKMEFVTF